jgi:hypothetical protein
VALALSACAHRLEVVTDSTVHAENLEQEHKHEEAQTAATVDQHVETGPASTWEAEEIDIDPVPATPTAPARPAVHIHRSHGTATGPSSTDTHAAEATAAKVDDAKEKKGTEDKKAKEKKTDEGHPELPVVKCGLGGTIWGLAVLGIVVGSLLLARKFKII